MLSLPLASGRDIVFYRPHFFNDRKSASRWGRAVSKQKFTDDPGTGKFAECHRFFILLIPPLGLKCLIIQFIEDTLNIIGRFGLYKLMKKAVAVQQIEQLTQCFHVRDPIRRS